MFLLDSSAAPFILFNRRMHIPSGLYTSNIYHKHRFYRKRRTRFSFKSAQKLILQRYRLTETDIKGVFRLLHFCRPKRNSKRVYGGTSLCLWSSLSVTLLGELDVNKVNDVYICVVISACSTGAGAGGGGNEFGYIRSLLNITRIDCRLPVLARSQAAAPSAVLFMYTNTTRRWLHVPTTQLAAGSTIQFRTSTE